MILILPLKKSFVKTYTRKDGTVVKAHTDKRIAKAHDDKAENSIRDKLKKYEQQKIKLTFGQIDDLEDELKRGIFKDEYQFVQKDGSHFKVQKVEHNYAKYLLNSK